MFSHLLVPLDGSRLAEEALVATRELADKFNSQITLVHVMVNLPRGGLAHVEEESHDDTLQRIHVRAHNAAEEYLTEQLTILQSAGFSVDSLVVESHSAAEAILSTAVLKQATAIVMSTHGRSGINRWVFGSIAEKVLRGAEIPVVLIRAGMETN